MPAPRVASSLRGLRWNDCPVIQLTTVKTGSGFAYPCRSVFISGQSFFYAGSFNLSSRWNSATPTTAFSSPDMSVPCQSKRSTSPSSARDITQ